MANFLDDYAPVEDRLRDFWSDHADGRIVTELVHQSDGEFIFKASAFRTRWIAPNVFNDQPDATGYARDSETQLPPNMKASALEVCETSAIGRALANLGYAAKGKRPSREEMQKASGEGSARSGAAGALSATSPDIPPAASGEAVAAPEPGEGSVKTSPGSTTYPLDPAKCSHKFPSGRWLKWDADDRCPRCGTPKVSAVEGTTADLGAA